jgi:putative transposase
MKKTRFTETQIVSILKQHEGGRSTKDLNRKHGISEATIYNWKTKYGGIGTYDVKRLKELEDENPRLKNMYADLTLDKRILKDLFTKKGSAPFNSDPSAVTYFHFHLYRLILNHASCY